uniref:C-type lectin domain-containing protein n=1 Tax=Panagrolaimus superbus TaxID=310955 RepID=A0A914YR97_9BILA
MNIQDGTWFSDNYENFKQFVCVMEAPSPCPHGWTYNSRSGYCYFVKEGLASWEENEDWCFSQGGAHLASVHSDDENNFITNLINFSEGEGYICGSDQLAWIGLYTVTNQTTWRWTDNSLFDYTAWATCKPDNAFRGANCAVIQNPQVCRNCTINVGNLRSWSDAMCYDNYKFGVCKKLP